MMLSLGLLHGPARASTTTASGDFTQDLFTLNTTTHADTANVVFDGIKYLKNVKADIKADLDMDMPNMKFTFKENEATDQPARARLRWLVGHAWG
jgi:hypothetical protein